MKCFPITISWDGILKFVFGGANHRRSEIPVFREYCHTFNETDARRHELQLLESENRNIIHPYSDRELVTAQVSCYSIPEILSEKMRSLLQRNRGEARDYYVWYIKNNIPDIDWVAVKSTFFEKCKFKNISFHRPDDFFREDRIIQAQTNWGNRLKHQLPKGIWVESKAAMEELSIFFNELF